MRESATSEIREYFQYIRYTKKKEYALEWFYKLVKGDTMITVGVRDGDTQNKFHHSQVTNLTDDTSYDSQVTVRESAQSRIHSCTHDSAALSPEADAIGMLSSRPSVKR